MTTHFIAACKKLTKKNKIFSDLEIRHFVCHIAGIFRSNWLKFLRVWNKTKDVFFFRTQYSRQKCNWEKLLIVYMTTAAVFITTMSHGPNINQASFYFQGCYGQNIIWVRVKVRLRSGVRVRIRDSIGLKVRVRFRVGFRLGLELERRSLQYRP